MPLLLPSPCLLVLAGPVASGKSTWAATHFPPSAVVSSDALRGVVGAGEDDIAASADAFALLEEIVARRVARGLTTVVDTTGMDAERRARWRALARAHGMACVAVAVDTTAAVCRARNRARPHPVPAAALTAQLRAWPAVRDALDGEGFDRVLRPEPRPGGAGGVRPLGCGRAAPAGRAGRAAVRAAPLGVSRAARRPSRPGSARSPSRPRTAGFDAIYTMDHFRQIPQVGRAWDDFLESFTTLAWLAACTSRVRLGALVAGVTYRNVGHLAKIVATLDVLSGGRVGVRARAGLVRRRAPGVRVAVPVGPASGTRCWRTRSRRYRCSGGRAASRSAGGCWTCPTPRLTPARCRNACRSCSGGGGERRTLALAARYADVGQRAGRPADRRAQGRRAARALRGGGPGGGAVASDHRVGRPGIPPSSTRWSPGIARAGTDPARWAAAVHAGTVDDQIGRFRELAEAGVEEVAVRLVDLVDTEPLSRMAPVIAAFR